MIDQYIENIIKNNLVDMVVWGRRVETDRCGIFDRFMAENNLPEENRYLLRDIDDDDPTNVVDFSLNR